MNATKEGKAKVSNYRVLWEHEGDFESDYWQALSAQQAVDFCREYSMPEGAEVIEVAKVVKNWK